MTEDEYAALNLGRRGPPHPVLDQRIDPQPPRGIKYMLGGESWIPMDQQSPRRLHCEEWGNLGPMEMNAEIKPNKAGFRVRCTTIPCPAPYNDFRNVDGVYYWTVSDRP